MTECARIGHPTAKATPAQVRAEAWMALIRGSRGLIYFVHEWKPRFNEAALLDDPDTLAAVTSLNAEIAGLAAVLNTPAEPDAVHVTSEPADVPVALSAHRYQGSLYLFAVGLRDQAVRATFRLAGLSEGGAALELPGETRRLAVQDGVFTDEFLPWGVHLYRIPLDAVPGTR
jgi:hypothetical protein